MDPEEFRKAGKAMVDFIADYVESIRDLQVLPDLKPGYLQERLSEKAPEMGEPFEAVMKDIQDHVMPGVTQWHHPHFFAYYPTASSLPSVLGGMLSDAIAVIGFSWISSPSCTELEVVTLDWLVHAMDLPKHFLSSSKSGGGVIQGSASESTLMAVLAARSRCIREMRQKDSCLDIGATLNSMVAYMSDQAHSSVERACDISLVTKRLLPSNKEHAFEPETLKLAIEEDRKAGRIPLICIATLGTTNSCAFDDIEGLATVSNNENIWIHVDAAYAGTALLCPEYRHLGKGLHLVDSYNFNAHKMMKTVFDCSPMWFREKKYVVDAFNVDPQYLRDAETNMPDYRHWQLPLGRRFRSLKLFFVLRMFGIKGLQEWFRKHVMLAQHFAQLIRNDCRFELVATQNLGLVCFRVKENNKKTEDLYKLIKEDKRIYLVTSKFDQQNVYFIRVAHCSNASEVKDMEFAYNVICELFEKLPQ